MNDAKAQEMYLRRVEKESMRVIGESLGLPECPLPLCAMNQSKTERALDTKGWNLCPPCDVKAQAILKQKGVVWKIERPPPRKPAAEPPPAEKK